MKIVMKNKKIKTIEYMRKRDTHFIRGVTGWFCFSFLILYICNVDGGCARNDNPDMCKTITQRNTQI